MCVCLFIGDKGVGMEIHESPDVYHYTTDEKHAGWILSPGMCITVEPILVTGKKQTNMNGGTTNAYVDPGDKWTVHVPETISAQFEHCVGITDKGIEIFTSPTKPYPDVWCDVLCDKDKDWLLEFHPDIAEKQKNK
ncbi:methionine aminopeptidase, type I [Reticulomyxa filosa]|uniref:Methionine aminopeptidase, type I n=1 Tax=Reticulomyxa filosa TaxID=46433 RepID=X6NET0_RETFI|nr:methionine aminopeptidase, type I [Reticulomyxa filosa]|eukprot:ETO24486.1 methionine aminopeptidase, type I [Reticulomyxa filosa]